MNLLVYGSLMKNLVKKLLQLIDVMSGSYIGQVDIVCFEDFYGQAQCR